MDTAYGVAAVWLDCPECHEVIENPVGRASEGSSYRFDLDELYGQEVKCKECGAVVVCNPVPCFKHEFEGGSLST